MRAAITVYELLLGAGLLFGPWSRLWGENWFVWRAGGWLGGAGGGILRGAVSGLGAALLICALGRTLGIAVVAEDSDA